MVDFVQKLLLQESDSNATDVVANIAEVLSQTCYLSCHVYDVNISNSTTMLNQASVAPDLRRVVLYWEPQRLNSENQTISKRKVAGIERRLQSQERWIRAQVTRHLNLKVHFVCVVLFLLLLL